MTDLKYSIADMLYLMKRLRDPDTGCPWDVKQTFATIVPFTLEEVYEVIDAIERGDYDDLKEELGDLLFQVVFYSQLAQECEYFDFSEVVSNLVEKLVSRHPHVFPEGTLESVRDSAANPDETGIKRTWEELKNSERKAKGRYSLLDDIPAGLPALARAQKVQKRAANAGFDWPNISGVLDKIREEAEEIATAASQGNQINIEEEIGDLLFTCVNFSRHLGVESEGALRRATRKFERRFQYLEKCAAEAERDVDSMSPEQLNVLWEASKSEVN